MALSLLSVIDTSCYSCSVVLGGFVVPPLSYRWREEVVMLGEEWWPAAVVVCLVRRRRFGRKKKKVVDNVSLAGPWLLVFVDFLGLTVVACVIENEGSYKQGFSWQCHRLSLSCRVVSCRVLSCVWLCVVFFFFLFFWHSVRDDRVCVRVCVCWCLVSEQIRRAAARRIGTTYAPDFLGLMEVGLVSVSRFLVGGFEGVWGGGVRFVCYRQGFRYARKWQIQICFVTAPGRGQLQFLTRPFGAVGLLRGDGGGGGCSGVVLVEGGVPKWATVQGVSLRMKPVFLLWRSSSTAKLRTDYLREIVL